MLPGPTNVPPRVMRAMLKPLIGHRGPEFKELFNKLLGKTKEVFEKIAKANPDAKALAVVYNETSTGVTVRALERLGEMSADHDMLLIVDAISILGGDKLPVDDWNVDICVTASQKCLMTPPGLAFISVSDKAWTKIKSKKVNRSYYLDLLMYQKYI